MSVDNFQEKVSFSPENILQSNIRKVLAGILIGMHVLSLSTPFSKADNKEVPTQEFLDNSQLEKMNIEDRMVYQMLLKFNRSPDNKEKELVRWKIGNSDHKAKWIEPDVKYGKRNFDVIASEYDVKTERVTEVHTHPVEFGPHGVDDIERALLLEFLYSGKFMTQTIDKSGNIWTLEFDKNNKYLQEIFRYFEKEGLSPGTNIYKNIKKYLKIRNSQKDNPLSRLEHELIEIYAEEGGLAGGKQTEKSKIDLMVLRELFGIELSCVKAE
ncbi:MAG: hypothetical protein PHU71_03190 [Candidatus Gracilibacteria bacterium]|nr:hypothetical protein [Candidatus Gracilibacteria bacterium]